MTDMQRVALTLIQSGLTGQKKTLPSYVDWAKLLQLGKRHHILPLLYYGVYNCQALLPVPVEKELKSATMQSVIIDNQQQHGICAICEAFEENGIDYMPLKGILLKARYPKPEMRAMSDADILIKTAQYEKIRSVMQSLGFTEQKESDHELIWQKGILTVELHKSILPSYNKDYYTYFGDGWRLAKLCDGVSHRYEMSKEDAFIFNFTHMAKHYRDGGIGIRHFVDIYFLSGEKNPLDMAYVERELTKLRLWDFYRNVQATLSVWFAGDAPTEKTDFITDYVFSSGSFGTVENHVYSYGVKQAQRTKAEKVGRKELWTKIFLPYDTMCKRYPVLEKAAFLLPIMWIVRWVEVVLFRSHRVKEERHRIKQLSADNIESFQQALDYVGLRFDFHE